MTKASCKMNEVKYVMIKYSNVFHKSENPSLFIDLLVGLISVLTDIIWHITVSWTAGNLACKLVRFLQVWYQAALEGFMKRRSNYYHRMVQWRLMSGFGHLVLHLLK